MTQDENAAECVLLINQRLSNKSLRAVAGDLNMNPGNLSATLNGKRKPTRKLMKVLGIKLEPRRVFDLSNKEAREIGARVYIVI
jgi:hypothetical protein